MALEKLEKTISTDRKGIFTIVALLATIGMYANSTRLSSPFFGFALTTIYFLINSVFAGSIFLRDEKPNFRFLLGLLLLLMLVAIGGATIIVASGQIPIKFDNLTTTALLILITMILSFLSHTKIARKLLKD
ncbi:MAG: hypothetical protein JSV85_07245 [Candidatus Bathyarchaeota archaeon]|nr:MAG: hypothetical protein JSV85_07245 [Candidatus Bathyarchaeota archaeon]